MHYARQDLLWLKYHLNVQPKNIFCTKVVQRLLVLQVPFMDIKI